MDSTDIQFNKINTQRTLGYVQTKELSTQEMKW